MSTSHFDDLLGDFGDSTTFSHSTVTHKTSTTHATFDDDFDPFGQSSPVTHTSHERDSELLLDFSSDAEIKNGETSGAVDHSSNPFSDMTTDTKSSNQFYDFGSGSANPLYDLASDSDADKSSNPLYEFTTTTTTTQQSPVNPLYGAFDDSAIDEDAEESDLLSGTNERQGDEEEEEDYVQSSRHHYDEGSHFQEQVSGQQESFENSVSQYIDEGDHHEPGELQHEERHEDADEGRHYQEEEGRHYQEEEGRHYQEEEGGHYQDEDDNKYSTYEFVEERHEVPQGSRVVTKVTHTTETRYSGADFDNSQASEDFSSNHWDEERSHQKADYGRPHQEEQDIIHFSETSTTRSKIEPDPTPAPRKQVSVHKEVHSPDAGVYESEPQTFQQWQNEAEDGDGVHESQPKKRDDVVREADTDKTADLPPVGTAQSMRARFMSSESTTHVKHESPNTAHHSAGGEYVSEPRGYVEKYEGKAESGVFESEPVHNPDVVRSGEELKEELPERGMAKNLANRFRQISTEGSSVSVTKSKRDITPERPARVEHVSEHKSHQSVDYAVKVDAGVFENQPQRSADVITSESVPDDYIPEKGFARNVAAKFREMESTVKSPTHSPIRKREITPPREEIRSHQAVVVENTPEVTSNIVHASDALEETLPERGMARNIALRFRQMEAENKSPGSPKAKKDLTPSPKDSGVYENQPKQFHADYSRPAESGFAENQPVRRDDVVRGDEPPKIEEELPERGAAKNLVNKWRQMESEGAKLKSPGSSGRAKDFTPVREDSRASQHKKSPRTPLSPSGHGQMDNGSVHPSDLPGQYQPQIEASVFESSPHERSDVVREADSDSTDGLPKKDTAKKMLARFQSIQAEANKQAPGPVSRKDSDCSENEIFDMMENAREEYEDDNKVGRSKSMRAAIQTEKCGACDKTVYAMERLEMNKRVYHKACFRCTQCKAVLTPKTFAINNDIIFCTTHYKQLFATKGNYDEGFGRMQHKKRWNSNPNLTKDEEEDDKS